MPSELRDLLERGAERPSAEPDFTGLARRGRRRRYTQRATRAMAVVAVLALVAGVMVPRLRQPDVVFDSGPRGGIGTWERVPASPLGAREDATALADGDRVIVYGGTEWVEEGDPSGDIARFDGAVYDLDAGTWATFPVPPQAFTEDEHWVDVRLLEDGRLLVVNSQLAVALYDFGGRSWETTAPAPLSFRSEPVLEWTGDRLVVWGGWSEAGERGDGAVWHPETGWKSMARSPLGARSGMASVWTGDRLLVWGGSTGDPQRGEHRVHGDGAGYDPVTDTWTPMADAGLSGREEPVSLWTGEQWILVGGFAAVDYSGVDQSTVESGPRRCDGRACSASAEMAIELDLAFEGGGSFHDGARYDPKADAWTPIAPPPERFWNRGIVNVAGRIVARNKSKEAVYDAESDSWSVMARPALNPMWDTYAVGGRTVILNSGENLGMNDQDRPRRLGGVVFDAEAERWDNLAEADAAQRSSPAVAVAGNRLFIWGGLSVTRDISQGYSGEDGDPWHRHDDGAVLTLE